MAWLTIFTYNTKFETFPNTKIVTSSWHPPPLPYSTLWKPEVEKAWVLCSCLSPSRPTCASFHSLHSTRTRKWLVRGETLQKDDLVLS
jgi:hypothetical protein